MHPFTAIMLALFALVLVAVVVIGIWYPGSGAEQLGWRSQRAHAEDDAAADAEDLRQLLEATNRRRRARGEPELTVEGLIAEETAPKRPGG